MEQARSYPPALGMYSPTQLPAVISGTTSPLWAYSAKALQAAGDLPPYTPSRTGGNDFVLKLLTKDQIIAELEADSVLKNATPNNLERALTAPPIQLVIAAQPGPFGHAGATAPLNIYLHKFYIDRLRAESGSLAEIFDRWSEESELRACALRTRDKIWAVERDLIQNKLRCFVHMSRGKAGWPYPRFIDEGDWLEFERAQLVVMNSCLFQMNRLERGLVTDQENEERERQREEARAARERQQAEEKEKQAALEKKRAEEEEVRKEQARLAAEKAEREREEKEAATAVHVLNAQMTIQGKIAAFQAASGALTADLVAGKITSDEYREKMAAISAILQ